MEVHRNFLFKHQIEKCNKKAFLKKTLRILACCTNVINPLKFKLVVGYVQGTFFVNSFFNDRSTFTPV